MANIFNDINTNFRIDKGSKSQANEFFKKLNMNIPNQRLINALEEVEAIENGTITPKQYDSFEEVLKDSD